MRSSSASSSAAVGWSAGGVTTSSRSPYALSAESRHGSGNVREPASGVDDPHATGTSSRPIRASRPRATSAPRGHRTSPVPDTVTASRSTSGRDVRYDSATMIVGSKIGVDDERQPRRRSLLGDGSRRCDGGSPLCDRRRGSRLRWLQRRHRRHRTPPAAAARPTRRARCRVRVVSRLTVRSRWMGWNRAEWISRKGLCPPQATSVQIKR